MPLSAFYHFPFTLSLLSLIFIAGLFTGTYKNHLSEEAIERFGFAPVDLKSGKIARIYISALVADKPSAWIQALLMVAVTVGGIEWRLGTGKAALSFWGIHTATVLLFALSLVFPFSKKDSEFGAVLTHTRDVGASGGYFGCLGVLAHHLPFPHRILHESLRIAMLAALLFIFFRNASKRPLKKIQIISDATHAVSFALGWLISYFL